MPRQKIIVQDMTPAEVRMKIDEIKAELFNLRFRNAMRQLDNSLEIRYIRRDLARYKTALAEHEQGIRKLAGGHED